MRIGSPPRARALIRGPTWWRLSRAERRTNEEPPDLSDD
ncbi:Hypothetical protein AA314_03332 [Archangium gephyra]|uniref:Uncharacterized protein n=1 Tax=Archangium gephyra TaxID=48 RepID=A0AAC8Q635_9BACT|nr:Hypothetical protein AA314_03332 [Archangium gephyra]